MKHFFLLLMTGQTTIEEHAFLNYNFDSNTYTLVLALCKNVGLICYFCLFLWIASAL